MSSIDQYATSGVCKILVGNKCDQNSKRQVSFNDGKNLARECGVQFFEASAKNSTNVYELFMAIATEIKHKLLGADPSADEGKVKLSKSGGKKQESSGGCC